MYEIIKAYFLHVFLYLFYGCILIYPDRGLNSCLSGLTLMTLNYNILHRALHTLPTTGLIGYLNLHVYLHHNKELDIPRWTELFLEFLFEMFLTVCIPVIISYYSGEWITPFSIILYCSLFFAINHVLFYSILSSDAHMKHHDNPVHNFIPDYLDHLFGTNADGSYEDMNQQIPLILISALITFFAKSYFQWKD
jgi:hypothetical protein